jgi:hypothetical protein
MEQYQKVKQCFEKNECRLLTTFEEFEELRKMVRIQYYQYVRVEFIGSCMHKSSVIFTNFYIRKTGKICKICIKQKRKDQIKESKNTNEIEYEGIKLIEEYLSPYYDMIRTKEGCLADIAIRRKTSNDNIWIPIQIKTTMNISHGMYSFGIRNMNYNNMLVICICISEKKLWIFPFNHLSITCRLNISVRSKYNKYKVDASIINTYIDGFDPIINHMAFDEIMKPICSMQQREQEYVRKREESIPFLNYEYPNIQNTCVDVIINRKNVQEKVLGYNELKNGLHCGFYANHGKINGIRNFRSYRLGENDLYWLHSSIDDRFWIIPEQALYERGYISDINETRKRTMLWIKPNTLWLNKYEYHYNNINREKLMQLFS